MYDDPITDKMKYMFFERDVKSAVLNDRKKLIQMNQELQRFFRKNAMPQAHKTVDDIISKYYDTRKETFGDWEKDD